MPELRLVRKHDTEEGDSQRRRQAVARRDAGIVAGEASPWPTNAGRTEEEEEHQGRVERRVMLQTRMMCRGRTWTNGRGSPAAGASSCSCDA